MVWVGKTWAGSVGWALAHHSRAAPTVAVAVIGGSWRTVRKTIGVYLLTLDNAHSYPVTAITVNAFGTAALAGPDQRSSTSGPSLHRPPHNRKHPGRGKGVAGRVDSGCR